MELKTQALILAAIAICVAFGYTLKEKDYLKKETIEGKIKDIIGSIIGISIGFYIEALLFYTLNINLLIGSQLAPLLCIGNRDREIDFKDFLELIPNPLDIFYYWWYTITSLYWWEYILLIIMWYFFGKFCIKEMRSEGKMVGLMLIALGFLFQHWALALVEVLLLGIVFVIGLLSVIPVSIEV